MESQKIDPEQNQVQPETVEAKAQDHPKSMTNNYLCITGVQQHMIEKDLIKYLRKNIGLEDANKIPLKGVMKKRGNNFAFLQFSDKEQMDSFKELYQNNVVPQFPKMKLKEPTGSKKMNNKEFVRVKDDEEMKKDEELNKAKKEATKEEIEEEMKISLEEKVTPYAKYSYEEQIKKKTEQLIETLRSFNKAMDNDVKFKREEMAPNWYSEDVKNSQQPCPLSHIITCDDDYINEYRNKVEFTIGKKYETGEICIGFNKGNLNKGITFVDDPSNIKSIPMRSIKVAKQVEQLVKQSGVEPYDRKINTGYWRIVLYRESKQTKQCLISIVVSKEYLGIDQTKQTEIEKHLIEMFPVGHKLEKDSEYTLVSLSMIFSNDLSGGYKDNDQLKLLAGQPYYEEMLFSYRFQVSPFAFFQVNTNVFEKMLKLITNFAQIDKETILFDICCGTGAIGISLNENAQKVIGIELIESAVDNAKHNIQLNADKIEQNKCEFYAGRAEELLPNIVKEYSNKSLRIVGIVDPPRSGLHKDVLKALRTCKGLDRLVYVSCNPQSQMSDLKYLCYSTTKKRKAPSFRPIQCVGADLFPHTNHIESIVLLERFYD